MKTKLLFSFLGATLLHLGCHCVEAQITLTNQYENEISPTIGTFQNIIFREGGFSSLAYIANTNGKEFWTVTDRGVNIDAENANANATPSLKYPTCKPTYDKIYAFANYAPKIHRIKIEGNEIQILESITIKRPDGIDATGLINPTGLGSTALEVATTNTVTDCDNFDLNTAPKDIWGIDAEGIDVDKEGNFWICEEGGPTIWKVNPKGIVLKRYTPYASNQQPEDISIDACFAYRRNNRGFEGITVTPNGKIYAIIQSPMYYKAVSGVAGSGTLSNSQIHRILEIDPITNTMAMYAYVNQGTIGTIKPKDFKIGDLRAINNTTFLVIEQATGQAPDDVKKMYTIDISNATKVKSGLAYGGKTLEELNSEAGLTKNSIVPVSKKLTFDLYEKGWPTTLDKAEGIAIIDKNTIAINNDNDYGQVSNNKDGIASATGIKSSIYVFNLQGNDALVDYVANQNVVLNTVEYKVNTNRLILYPNPATATIFIQNKPIDSNFVIYTLEGKKILTSKINLLDNSIDLSSLEKGLYTIEIDQQYYKIIKN